MIVAATIHLSKSSPFISYGIIQFSLFARIINIFARSCHNYKVLSKRAAGVTVASVSHLSALF